MSELEDVLDHYGIRFQGDRSGEQSICCPVHDDRDPSASLNLGEDKQLWRCHACGEAGDALTIIMKREGVGYKAAVAQLEGITGRKHGGARGEQAPRKRVPAGTGYRPRSLGKVPSRRRERRSYE